MSLLEVLDAALRGADGEVELSAAATHQGTARFANSRVTQTGDVKDVVLQARVRVGRRVGAARANQLESIGALIARAREAAAAQTEPPLDPGGFDDGKLPTPEVPPSFDAATAACEPGERAALFAPALKETARLGLSAAGLALTSVTDLAVATTAGCRRAWRSTTARLDVIASDGDAAARIGRCAVGLAGIDAAEVAQRACERAARSRQPIDVEPGAWDVLLEPPAVAELLEWLAITGLAARSFEDGSSCLAGRAGERLAGRATIYDDALSGDDGCPTQPFDSEGTPRQKVVFLDEGVARGPVHDRASAARAGVASTGHATPVGDELFEGGPAPLHLQLARGQATLDELVGQMERGLYVARFHYVNGLVDTRRALMTGMTRDGLFLVENGRVGRAVRNLRWTESLLEALGRAAGMTRAREVVASGLTESITVAPSVLLRGWRFTGTTR